MSVSSQYTFCARPGIGLVILFLVCFVSPAQAQRAGEKSRRVESPLRVAETQAEEFVTRLILDDAVYREVKSSDRITIANFALDPQRRVDLELERIEVFAPDAKIVRGTLGGDVPMPRPDVVLLGGHITGQPDSRVFLSLSPYGNNGLIEIGAETFVVANRQLRAQRDTVIYNLATLPEGAITWADFKCGTGMPLVAPGGPAAAAAAQEMAYRASSQAVSRRVTMAIEADYEYTNLSYFSGDPGAAAAYATTLVGAASEVYSRDVDTRLEIGYLRVWTDSADPYSATTAFPQLEEFQAYWNANMTGVTRHVAQLLSGRLIDGGWGYPYGLCNTGWDYSVSGNISGSFPYPVQSYHPQNWDIFVVIHELGHNFGAWHTHDITPQIDGCGTGDCSAALGGTIMSYCGSCPGGYGNVDFRFHERMIAEKILPALDIIWCDLTAPPENCTAISPPSVGIVSNTNRTLSVVGGNPGAFSGLRVTISGHLPPFDVLNGTQWWVGPPQAVSENGGKADPAEAPAGYPTYIAATLRCDPYYTDWGGLGTTHVAHEVVLPGGTYTVEEILSTCPQSEPSNWSSPLTLTTSKYGDVVGDCAADPCTPPDTTVDITTDVTAILNKFKNLVGAPIKARADVEPATPDYVINISDVTYALMAFRGFDYPFPVPTVSCP